MKNVLRRNEVVGSQSSRRDVSSTEERVSLGLVLILALTLRIYGLDFGLPYLYDPDENAFVDPALRMVWYGDLNPHWFGHPGTTVMYINALLYEFINATGRILGWFTDWSGFRSFYFADPTLIYLVPRAFYALFGTFTVFLVYLVARAVYGGLPAIVAALALAVSPLHITYSQLIRTDVLASGLILLVGYFAIRIARTRSLDAYLWAGALTGMSVATKYPSVIAASMVFFAHLLGGAGRVKESWKLLAAAISTVVALFISSPYLFLDYPTVLSNMQEESRSNHLSANGGGVIENLWWYVNQPLAHSVGWPALCLSLLAVFFAVRNRQRDAMVLVAFAIIFLVFIASLNLRWARWVIPTLPFLAILMAGGLRVVCGFIRTRWPSVPEKGLIYIAAILTLLPVAHAAIQQAHEHTLPDTRTVARDWIVANIPRDSRLLVESYGPQLPRGWYQLFNVDSGDQLIDVDGEGGYGASTQVIYPSPESAMENVVPGFNIVGTVDVPNALLGNRIEYVVLSNFYERYREEAIRYQKNIENYERLFNIAKPVINIAPENGQMQGPHIRIFRLPAAATTQPPGASTLESTNLR